MPILRNPFARRQDVQTGLQPSQDDQNASPRPSFERVSTVASQASSLSIKTARSEEPPEYKMSGTKTFVWMKSELPESGGDLG